MQKIQSYLAFSVIISGLSHIFCCGIPLMFSLLSVLMGLGVATVLPAGFIEIHDLMHVWEIPIFLFSGIVLFCGWTFHIISERIDCHNTGCGHEPCVPKKNKSSYILITATGLFILNGSFLYMAHNEDNLFVKTGREYGYNQG